MGLLMEGIRRRKRDSFSNKEGNKDKRQEEMKGKRSQKPISAVTRDTEIVKSGNQIQSWPN